MIKEKPWQKEKNASNIKFWDKSCKIDSEGPCKLIWMKTGSSWSWCFSLHGVIKKFVNIPRSKSDLLFVLQIWSLRVKRQPFGVGKNILLNRMYDTIKNKIDKNWLQLGLNSYKIKCKTCSLNERRKMINHVPFQ